MADRRQVRQVSTRVQAGPSAGLAALLVAALAAGCTELTDPRPGSERDTGALVPPPQMQFTGADLEVLTTVEIDRVCRTVTFENAPHYLPIIGPAGNTAFSSNWRTLTRGAYAKNPSGTAIAVWLQEDTASLHFLAPVSEVGLWYSSYVPVRLQALDAEGGLLAEVVAEPNVSRGFTTWDVVSVAVPGNDISDVVVWGTANRTAVDDVWDCTRLAFGEVVPDVVAEVLSYVETLVEDGVLEPGEARSLHATLGNAAATAIRGNATAALNMLEAFRNKVDALSRSRRLTEEQAATLLGPVLAVLQAFGR